MWAEDLIPIASGACAGLSVDIVLFPLDTLKTRLQAANGFWKSGGFRGVYKGMGSVAVGSMPSAAVFFVTYEKFKLMWHNNGYHLGPAAMGHSVASSCGEILACLVRVPTEVIKQRTQAGHHQSSWQSFSYTVKQEGIRGLYRGYLSTVSRDVPFAFIQYPVWEGLKKRWSYDLGKPLTPIQSALCGAVAGSIAASLTTPLDVAKTRIMLASKGTSYASGNILTALRSVYKEKGFRGLYAGIVPRTIWISAGGFVFLGSYDTLSSFLWNLL